MAKCNVGLGLAALLLVVVESFTIQTQSSRPTMHRATLQNHMLPEASSLLVSVEVFDGSAIDPVVVSDVFWTSLKTKILAVVIGQILAAVAFAIISTVLASQIAQLGDFVNKQFLSSFTPKDDSGNKGSTFIKANEISSRQPAPDFSKLLICIVIDVLGSASEIVPILGEVTDVIYAPIAATVLRSLYGSNILFALEFTEEILPFTDILPLATICWVVDTFYPESDIARVLQLGKYSPRGWAENAIDTSAQSREMQLPSSNKDGNR